jgi:sporulation protein YlmC with PRC-barrel domain
MLKIRKASDVLGKNVYTSEGDFFGQVDEINLVDNKIDGWKIKVGSGFMSMFGGARGVVIPHQFVKAVGDILIVNKASLPSKEEMTVDASDSLADELV